MLVEYVPAPQSVQLESPWSILYLPAAHATQTIEPLGIFCKKRKPGAHWQLAELFISSSTLPARHSVSWHAPAPPTRS